MKRQALVLMLCLFLGGEAGAYRITAYCPDSCCCGSYADGITATGKKVRLGMIAVDPKVIPLHSLVRIAGLGEFVAEDIGGAIKGKRIDIFMRNHRDALEFGVQHRNVAILRRGK